MTQFTFEEKHDQREGDLYLASDEIYTGVGAVIMDYDGCFSPDDDPADYNRRTLTGWRR